MTLQEFVKQRGIAYSTAAVYAQKAGWTRNSVKTERNDSQQTALLEAVKQEGSRGPKANLLLQTEGIDTALSRAFRIDRLHKRIEAKIAAENAGLVGKIYYRYTDGESNIWRTTY